LVGKGRGARHLAPATIDVLGYAPDLVERPAAALSSFVAERPDHPYARLSADTVASSAEWLSAHVPPLAYVGTLEENYLLPTAVGVPKPSAFVPVAMAAGALRSGGRWSGGPRSPPRSRAACCSTRCATLSSPREAGS